MAPASDFDVRRSGGVAREPLLPQIEGGLHASDEIEELLAQAVDLAGHCAMKLTQGGAPRLVIFGADEFGYRLGLGEVETAGEEGALGELAGPGVPRSGTERRLQDGFKDHASAVTLDFNGRFTGVGAPLRHMNGKDFVDRFRRVSGSMAVPRARRNGGRASSGRPPLPRKIRAAIENSRRGR